MRSERGADISFFTQPGPIATYCAALLVGSLTAQSGHQPPGATTGSVENDPTVWTGRALQAESSEWLVLRICIRPLRGADHTWPSWISARVRSHSEIGPRRPVGSPDHERDGETVFHFSNPTCRPRRVSPTTKWSSRIDWSHPFGATVARSPPIGERRWRRRVAVIPLVNQSELISLLR